MIGLVFTSTAFLAVAQARQDELFQSWEKMKADTRSLVVEYTLENLNRVSNEKVQFQGTFKMLRTPKGEYLASCTHTPLKKSGDVAEPLFSGLLNGDALYLLNPKAKTAMRFRTEEGNLRLWLEEHFNPFALLLDEKHARANYNLQVIMQDQHYTYLDVKPKPRKGSGKWFEMRVDMPRGRAVFMNKDARGVPKDMPCQLWYEDPAMNSYTFSIRSWKANATDCPKAEEFTRPEDRPGWVVNGWDQ
jgi:hypothetical protein